MKEFSDTPKSMEEVLHPDADTGNHEPDFPDAPEGWRSKEAMDLARKESIELSADHWETIRILQKYFHLHINEHVNTRELHDALDERFHSRGGLRYLYSLFPGGPVAQGCRLAGVMAPVNAVDTGFGSVV